ncbi:MAG: hypothetical protein R3B93_03610 [Bacteroidia bacterium]
MLRKQGTSVELEDESIQMIFQPEELNLHDPLPYQKQRLTEILNSLSPRQREILYLKFYANLTTRKLLRCWKSITRQRSIMLTKLLSG